MLYYTDIDKNQPGVAELISDKADYKSINISRHKEEYIIKKKKVKSTMKRYNFAFALIT